MDISVRLQKPPRPGETVLGIGRTRSGGGKGANQAVAATVAGGAQTTFIGAVGNDADGAELQQRLDSYGVNALISLDNDRPTGLALVMVEQSGENSIVVVPGANASETPLTSEASAAIRNADVVIAQLEIPISVVLEAARMVEPGAVFILNAAPVVALPEDLRRLIDILIVNEHEAAVIADYTGADFDLLLTRLLAVAPVVIVTLGRRGCVYATIDGTRIRVDTPVVTSRDTTAAGDTFCGVFAAALAAGESAQRGLELASSAGALSVQREGAQESIPNQADVAALSRLTYVRSAGRSN